MRIGREIKIEDSEYWNYMGEYWVSLFYQNLLGEANRFSIDYFDKASKLSIYNSKRYCDLLKLSGDC